MGQLVFQFSPVERDHLIEVDLLATGQDADLAAIFGIQMCIRDSFEDATASVSIFSSGYSNRRLPIKYWFWVLLEMCIRDRLEEWRFPLVKSEK